VKKLFTYKKYYTMVFYGILGIGLVLLLTRKDWHQRKQILANANSMIQHMPIDKTSMALLNPLFDFTNHLDNHSFSTESTTNANTNFRNSLGGGGGGGGGSSGATATKRSVSETKKKYVASSQDWKCGDCRQQLDHTYEIDHHLRLQYGGSNDIDNLVALCPHCHRKKTAIEIMQ
jgi:hypothetical protein